MRPKKELVNIKGISEPKVEKIVEACFVQILVSKQVNKFRRSERIILYRGQSSLQEEKR